MRGGYAIGNALRTNKEIMKILGTMPEQEQHERTDPKE